MRVSEAVEWTIELFELTGHEVIERVGETPGTVERLARKHQGHERPLTLWSIWPEAPADLDAALAGLERARQRAGADRAVGLVLAFMAEAVYGASSVIGLRGFAFEITGIADTLRALAEELSDYVTRPATFDGQPVDPVRFICDWVCGERRFSLTVYGRAAPSVSREAARRLAGRALAHAPDVPAVLAPMTRIAPDVGAALERARWLVHLDDQVMGSVDSFDIQLLDRSPLWQGDGGSGILRVALPPRAEVMQWYRRNLDPVSEERWLKAVEDEPALWEICAIPQHWNVSTIRSLATLEGTSAEWTTQYVIRVMERAGGGVSGELAAGFFEHFALGRSATLDDFALPLHLVDNTLLRDYHVAHHIAARYRDGDRDLITRYRFPERYVLLFLAHLAPEALAHATADRTEDLRRQIASEVENEVQLTLSHHLRRSVGAARAQFKRIERALTREQRATLGREIGRLHEELDYQQRLAERTRLYHEVPDTETTDLDLISHVERVTAELKRRYPAITWDINLPTTLYARAQPDAVHDILHNVAENAAHAALRGDSHRVTLRAVVDAETIRIDVLDTGPGIAPHDRERIFDPRVTTKKGGDQPLGTGMGLPIARRYAAAVGGRVDLAHESAETCFVIRFVAARTRGEQ